MRPSHLAFVVLLSLLIGSPAGAAVRASLDSTEIAPGDTVTLTLSRDGQTSSEPDLTPLESDFDILGTRSSHNFQIINGRTSSKTEVMLTLAPKRSGRLSVPSITWDGERSAALTLNVTASAGGSSPSAARARADSRVFIETTADPKQPYVQGAVAVTVRVYSAETLYHANLEFPATSGALVMQVGSDENTTVERNGRQYDVLTRHYIVLPQRSGELTLSGPVLSAEIADRSRGSLFDNDPFAGFFRGSPFGGLLTETRPIRLHGDPITLDVRPRPAGVAGSYWLPARQVTVRGDWHPDPDQTHAGEPITLDLRLEAEGLTAEQLPDVAKLLSLPPGVRAYPDQPKLENTTRNGTVVGTRQQSIALIADQPGTFTVPALRIHWWDTRADAPREATLPAHTLVILPAANGSSSQTASAPAVSQTPARAPAIAAPSNQRAGSTTSSGQPGGTNPDMPWRWIAVALGLLWLGTVVAWIVSHRRRRAPARPPAPAPVSESSPPRALDPARERAAFRDACLANDAAAARRHLLAWARAVWPSPPKGLAALADASDDPALANRLRELDRACFAGTAWDGQALATLTDVPRPPATRKAQRPDLAPLYD